jgi:SAM-dependent methyltransferase
MEKFMDAITEAVRGHYSPSNLTARIKGLLADVAPSEQRLTVEQLAALDQFHTRGLAATSELAGLAGIDGQTEVLDLGSGLGGPARYLAATYGCRVVGVDLSPEFVEAAAYLAQRCGLADRVTFKLGSALDLPVPDQAFEVVFLQHVAMNISDRERLYGEAHRVLRPGGRLAIYDVVMREGELHYPVPWALDDSTSFVLSADATWEALKRTGFEALHWHDDTASALSWFSAAAQQPAQGLSLATILGSEFPGRAANLVRNIREGRAGILSAILKRDPSSEASRGNGPRE